MKWIMGFFFFLIISFELVGCNIVNPPGQIKTEGNIEMNSTETSNPPNSFYPSSTVTSTPIPTPTLTILERDKALEEIISNPVDCVAPCFLGITPGKTTSEEALLKIRYYNLEPSITTFEGKSLLSLNHDLPNDIRISIDMPLLTNNIESINLNLDLNPNREDKWKDSLAYSPVTLIHRYGNPSKVEFAANYGPTTVFTMILYFAQEDLIAEYYAQSVEIIKKEQSSLCPLGIKYDFVRIWLGNNPLYPPPSGVPLEKVSSLTLNEFAILLEEKLESACFEVNMEAMLQ